MNPFDIELAKKGEKVITREGKPVRIICFDKKGGAPLIGLIAGKNGIEVIEKFKKDGRRFSSAHQTINRNDLFMY
jgi:hypothetical protein